MAFLAMTLSDLRSHSTNYALATLARFPRRQQEENTPLSIKQESGK